MSSPRDIRSIAVTADDVVAAFESAVQGDDRTVLRVTPPFSGRMRARIHVRRGDGPPGDDPAPVHVDPRSLVADPPPYPTADDTEDELRSDPDAEYTPQRHRERHVAALEAWRDRVRASVVETVELDLPDRGHEVAVDVLGP
jgi:hypothetical protein